MIENKANYEVKTFNAKGELTGTQKVSGDKVKTLVKTLINKGAFRVVAVNTKFGTYDLVMEKK